MIQREEIINAFVQLGKEIGAYINGCKNTTLDKSIENACRDNYWFTRENIIKALCALESSMLNAENLNKWAAKYSFASPKKVGLIMAGNIPLVGFHDFLCVLVSGNIAVVKPSSKDKHLIAALSEILVKYLPSLKARIMLREKPENIDMAIATGSNNSSRYFESLFKTIPCLVRKNRYSLAVISGNETFNELELLSDDVFNYFGLGCRNVSNIFVPKHYDWNMFFESLQKYNSITEHKEYSDCFRYQKAVFDLSETNYKTNGFVMIRENIPSFSSISVVNYTEYTNQETPIAFIEAEKNNIQCVVSSNRNLKNSIPFGQAQMPQLCDYADGVDVMEFLTEI